MQLSVALALGAALAASPSPPAATPAAAPGTGASAHGPACASPNAALPHDHAHAVPDPRTMTDEEWQAYVRSQLVRFDEGEPREEPPDPDPWAFSTFRGVRPEPMGRQTIINGAKMDVASLTIDEPPHVVEAEYLRSFQNAGVTAIRGTLPNTRGVRYLSYRRVNGKTFKTLTLIPNGRGTVVLASIGDPSQMLERKPELPAGMPVPPNASAAAVISQAEVGLSNNTSSFLVKDTTVDAVRGFYRDELAKRGFEIRSSQADTDSYSRDSTILSITARPHSTPRTVSVSVVWLQ